MNYDIIEQLLRSKNITQAELLGFINKTGSGYWHMRKKNTMPLNVFEKICEYLEVEPEIFFKEAPAGNFFNEGIIQHGRTNTGTLTKASNVELQKLTENLQQRNKELEQKVKDKEKIIKLLENQCSLMEKHLNKINKTEKQQKEKLKPL